VQSEPLDGGIDIAGQSASAESDPADEVEVDGL
jgi:hypothetical protein